MVTPPPTIDPFVQASIDARNALIAENALWAIQHPITPLYFPDTANKTQNQMMMESIALRSNQEALWNQTHGANQPYLGASVAQIQAERVAPYQNTQRFQDLLAEASKKSSYVHGLPSFQYDPSEGIGAGGIPIPGFVKPGAAPAPTNIQSPQFGVLPKTTLITTPQTQNNWDILGFLGGVVGGVAQTVQAAAPKNILFDTWGTPAGSGKQIIQDIQSQGKSQSRSPIILTPSASVPVGLVPISKPTALSWDTLWAAHPEAEIVPAPINKRLTEENFPLPTVKPLPVQQKGLFGYSAEDIFGGIGNVVSPVKGLFEVNPFINPVGVGKVVLDTGIAGLGGKDITEPIKKVIFRDQEREQFKKGATNWWQKEAGRDLADAQELYGFYNQKVKIAQNNQAADPVVHDLYKKVYNKGIDIDEELQRQINAGKWTGGEPGVYDNKWKPTDLYTRDDYLRLNQLTTEQDRLNADYKSATAASNKQIQDFMDKRYEADRLMSTLAAKNVREFATFQEIPGTKTSVYGAGKSALDIQEAALGKLKPIGDTGTAGQLVEGAAPMFVYTAFPELLWGQVLPLMPTALEGAIRKPAYLAYSANLSLNPLAKTYREDITPGSATLGALAPFIAPIKVSESMYKGEPLKREDVTQVGALIGMLGSGKALKVAGKVSAPVTEKIPFVKGLGIGGTTKPVEFTDLEAPVVSRLELGKGGKLASKVFSWNPAANWAFKEMTGMPIEYVTGGEGWLGGEGIARPNLVKGKIRISKTPTIKEAFIDGWDTLLGKEELLPDLGSWKIESGSIKALKSSTPWSPKNVITVNPITKLPESKPFEQDVNVFSQYEKQYAPKVPAATMSGYSGKLVNPNAKPIDVFWHTDPKNSPTKGVWLTEAEVKTLRENQAGTLPKTQADRALINKYGTQGLLKKAIGTGLSKIPVSNDWLQIVEQEVNALGTTPKRTFKGTPEFLTKYVTKEGFTSSAGNFWGAEPLVTLALEKSLPEHQAMRLAKYERAQDIQKYTKKPEIVRNLEDMVSEMGDGGVIPKGTEKEFLKSITKIDPKGYVLTGSVIQAVFSRISRGFKDLDILTNKPKEMANSVGEYFVSQHGQGNVKIDLGTESSSITIRDKAGRWTKRIDIHTHEFGGLPGQFYQLGLPVEKPTIVNGYRLMTLREARLRNVVSGLEMHTSTERDPFTNVGKSRVKDIGSELIAIKSEQLGASPKRSLELQDAYDILSLQTKDAYPVSADQLRISRESLAKARPSVIYPDSTFVKIPLMDRYLHVEGTITSVKNAPGAAKSKILAGYDSATGTFNPIHYTDDGLSAFFTKPLIQVDGKFYRPEIMDALVKTFEKEGKPLTAEMLAKVYDAAIELQRGKIYERKGDFAFNHPVLEKTTQQALLDTFTSGEFAKGTIHYGSKPLQNWMEKGVVPSTEFSDFDTMVTSKSLWNKAVVELQRIANRQNAIRGAKKLEVTTEIYNKKDFSTGKVEVISTVKLSEVGHTSKSIMEVHTMSAVDKKLSTVTSNAINGKKIITLSPETQVLQNIDGIVRRVVRVGAGGEVGLYIKKTKNISRVSAQFKQGAADILNQPMTFDVFGLRQGARSKRAAKLTEGASAIDAYYNDPLGMEADLMRSEMAFNVEGRQMKYKPWEDMVKVREERADARKLVNPLATVTGAKPLIDITGKSIAKGAAISGAIGLGAAVFSPASAASAEDKHRDGWDNLLFPALIGATVIGTSMTMRGGRPRTVGKQLGEPVPIRLEREPTELVKKINRLDEQALYEQGIRKQRLPFDPDMGILDFKGEGVFELLSPQDRARTQLNLGVLERTTEGIDFSRATQKKTIDISPKNIDITRWKKIERATAGLKEIFSGSRILDAFLVEGAGKEITLKSDLDTYLSKKDMTTAYNNYARINDPQIVLVINDSNGFLNRYQHPKFDTNKPSITIIAKSNEAISLNNMKRITGGKLNEIQIYSTEPARTGKIKAELIKEIHLLENHPGMLNNIVKIKTTRNDIWATTLEYAGLQRKVAGTTSGAIISEGKAVLIQMRAKDIPQLIASARTKSADLYYEAKVKSDSGLPVTKLLETAKFWEDTALGYEKQLNSRAMIKNELTADLNSRLSETGLKSKSAVRLEERATINGIKKLQDSLKKQVNPLNDPIIVDIRAQAKELLTPKRTLIPSPEFNIVEEAWGIPTKKEKQYPVTSKQESVEEMLGLATYQKPVTVKKGYGKVYPILEREGDIFGILYTKPIQEKTTQKYPKPVYTQTKPKEKYPQVTEQQLVEDIWGDYAKSTKKPSKYPVATYKPVTVAEILGYPVPTKYPKDEYMPIGEYQKYPKPAKYPKDEYVPIGEYPKYSKYPETYPKYPKYQKYPETYPKYPKYPETYPKYPKDTYPTYPKYPETYPKYPKYPKEETPKYPKTEYPRYPPDYPRYPRDYVPERPPIEERPPPPEKIIYPQLWGETEDITAESGVAFKKRRHYEAAPGAMPEEVTDILFGTEWKEEKPKKAIASDKKLDMKIDEILYGTGLAGLKQQKKRIKRTKR